MSNFNSNSERGGPRFAEPSFGVAGRFLRGDVRTILVVGLALGVFNVGAVVAAQALGHPLRTAPTSLASALSIVGFSVLFTAVLAALQARRGIVTPGRSVVAWAILLAIFVSISFPDSAERVSGRELRVVIMALGSAAASAWLYARRRAHT